MNLLNGEKLLAEWGLERIKAGSTFGALSDDAIRFLLCRGRVLSLQDREELFHTGDSAESFFVELQGQRDAIGKGKDGDVHLHVVAVGEQIGYVSMIGLFERLGCPRANGTTVVLEVDAELFYQLHLELPFDFGVLMLNLSREMARKTRVLIAQLVEAGSGHPFG